MNEPKQRPKTFLVWVDVETTGLDPEQDAVLEIALEVTDTDLRTFESFYEAFPFTIVKPMDDVVMRMHEESGLLAVCRAKPRPESKSLRPTYDFDIRVAEYLDILRRGYDSEGDAPLRYLFAGSSVHFDREFLRVWFPEIFDRLHYRNFDVSSLHRAMEFWAPSLRLDTDAKTTKKHRAKEDIGHSIYVAQWYRDVLRGAVINHEFAKARVAAARRGTHVTFDPPLTFVDGKPTRSLSPEEARSFGRRPSSPSNILVAGILVDEELCRRGELHIENLKTSIAEMGLVQPISVVRAAPSTGFTFRLVSGYRRLAAVKALGHPSIAAFVLDAMVTMR